MLKPFSALILSNTRVLPGVYLLQVGSPLSAQPGQYFMLNCGAELLLRRPLSAHRVVEGKLAFLFKVVGKGTYWLSQRKEGEVLDLLGPLGKGYNVHPNSQNILLLAGGLGIAPLMFLAEKSRQAGCSVTLLLGAKTESQLYPQYLLPQGMKVFVATEDGSAGERGTVVDLLNKIDFAFDQVFAAGPVAMYQALSELPLLKEKSVQVSLEVRLGCGFGGCFGCSIPTKKGMKLVCQDGPVFEFEDIIWEGVKI